MQFNNPNILYVLFALLIPILVHLFQLRKFQQTAFTNVKFLKQLVVQNRKSSTIKKWLVLLSRLLAFACIILAFAQPYIDKNKTFKQEQETVIYIDNSFSMQAKGAKGELLKVAVQELLTDYPLEEKISLITNDHTYKNTSLSDIKNDLINLSYSPKQLDYKTISLTANQLFSENQNSIKKAILISDFQQHNNIDISYFNDKYNTTLIQTLPVSKSNISIDSAYLASDNLAKATLNVVVKNQNSQLTNIPISLFNNDTLISKTAVQLEALHNTITFDLPSNKNLNLKIKLSESNFTKDNELFLAKNNTEKQQVLAIGTTENNQFLSKIFTTDEFVFTQNTEENINFSSFEAQHLIIVNELENLSASLIQNLQNYAQQGGTVVCIPVDDVNTATYNRLINVFGNKINHETRLTNINFSHPIFANVFEKEVRNFQFPNVKTHHKLFNYRSAILNLENGDPLLVHSGNFYVFSASLNSENTNIKQAPLIVPTLYNIAKSSLRNETLYYIIGNDNTIDIPAKLGSDDVLSLQKDATDFIPLQQSKGNKVTLQTTENPDVAGIYAVKNKQKITLSSLAYNYNRKESLTAYHNIEMLKNSYISTSNSVTETLDEINSMNEVNALWKWFIIFALVFLSIELLILKYFK